MLFSAYRQTSDADRSRRGQSMVEFTLTFLLFSGLVLGFTQLAFWMWTKTALHYAVREGVRFAITGSVLTGLQHNASIKQTVKNNSAGLLSGAGMDEKIVIEYFDEAGNPPSGVANEGGNTVVVSVQDYNLKLLFALPTFGLGSAGTVQVSAVDKLEPYAIPPAL